VPGTNASPNTIMTIGEVLYAGGAVTQMMQS
jgi:hypothetical protein